MVEFLRKFKNHGIKIADIVKDVDIFKQTASAQSINREVYNSAQNEPVLNSVLAGLGNNSVSGTHFPNLLRYIVHKDLLHWSQDHLPIIQ